MKKKRKKEGKFYPQCFQLRRSAFESSLSLEARSKLVSEYYFPCVCRYDSTL
jgi:hypothetical protein